MISKFKALWLKLQPLHAVLIFIIALFVSNLLWKISIYGEDTDSCVLLFNHWNISALFNVMVVNIAEMVRAFLSFLGFSVYHDSYNDILFATENRISIVWGCTAIKQSFIFLCIMLCSMGPWRSKIWYIPLGLFLIYLFNILRITIIAMVIEEHPQYFHVLHEGVLKYLFYAFIFFIWVYWEERIHKPAIPRKPQVFEQMADI